MPPGAVRVLGDGVWNTVDEVRLIAAELGRDGADRVIIVTSKAHSRRVRATWSAIVGRSPRAIVRYAEEEPYDSRGWWRNTRDALDVSREVFGLMNVWAGFPVQPDRRWCEALNPASRAPGSDLAVAPKSTRITTCCGTVRVALARFCRRNLLAP